MFDTDLSNEYAIAYQTFKLTREDVWNISLRSIDYAFLKDDEKDFLRSKWNDWKRNHEKME